MKTTAAVLRDPQGRHTIEELELPPPGPGELLVRVAATGYCHSDSLLRHVPDAPLPIVFGHEGSGIVETVGPGVTGISVGDHVVLTFDSCGACRNCLTAQPSYCDQFRPRNFAGHRLDGSPGAVDTAGSRVGHRWFGQSSFATHAISTVRNTVVVDRDVDLELLGPLGCGMQTGAGSIVNSLRVRPGSTLAVFGVGAVGMAAVMAARIAGAARVIAVDLHHSRLDLALSLGATDVLDGSTDLDVVSEIQRLTGGGADYAFDTTGAPAVIKSAILCLRMIGVCGLVGAGMRPVEIGPNDLFGKTVTGIFEGDAVGQVFIPRMIEWWRAGVFPFHRLIERFPLSEINAAESKGASGEVIKPVLIPGA